MVYLICIFILNITCNSRTHKCLNMETEQHGRQKCVTIKQIYEELNMYIFYKTLDKLKAKLGTVNIDQTIIWLHIVEHLLENVNVYEVGGKMNLDLVLNYIQINHELFCADIVDKISLSIISKMIDRLFEQ